MSRTTGANPPVGLNRLRTEYAPPPPSVYTPPAPAKKADPSLEGFAKGPNGVVQPIDKDHPAIRSYSYDNAPGQNAEEDARDLKELTDQQKARQKTLSGRATGMLSSFQNAQGTTPNLATRLLGGF